MCGFCNVLLCLCLGFVMCGCVHIWDFYCVGVGICGFCNLWVWVFVAFVMCVCVCFEMCWCVCVVVCMCAFLMCVYECVL